ncbi:MAG: hypothetical protein JF600_11100 [Xanthomonadales bacterium]|nr:hypothetical protein [Xanthomonadales bacterium]
MPASPPFRRLAAATPACAFVLALSACAAPSPISSAKEESPMSSQAHAAQAFSPKLDAGQALQKLLTLLRGAHRIEDIDGAALERAFGVPFTAHDGRLGFGERITRDWWTAMELDPKSPDGPRFEFSFRPDDPSAYPSASEICALDFDRFAAELTAAGFRRETYRGEHGRIINDTFERDALKVTVQTRGENDDSPEKIAHACVKTVLVD